MPPKAEKSEINAKQTKYYSFEKPDGKIDCDKAISITATIMTMSCIIAYFIYLATR
jgi:hypothetical protein